MTKFFLGLLVLITLCFGDVLSPGQNLIFSNQKVGATDTLKCELTMPPTFSGGFSFQYLVRNHSGNTKVKLYWQESNKPLYGGWFNTTRIDSCVAACSTLIIINKTNPTAYFRFLVIGFGAAGDTSKVWGILEATSYTRN